MFFLMNKHQTLKQKQIIGKVLLVPANSFVKTDNCIHKNVNHTDKNR